MIQVTDTLALDEDELVFDFVRASGPGGQNVNKVATAVELRFDVKSSSSLPSPVRQRLLRIAGRRRTQEGTVIIRARRFRTQGQNRRDAVTRLVNLIRKALDPPKTRIRTTPTPSSKERRLDEKRHRSRIKRMRGRTSLPEEPEPSM